MQLGKNALITLTSSQYFLLIEKLEENGRNIKKLLTKGFKLPNMKGWTNKSFYHEH